MIWSWKRLKVIEFYCALGADTLYHREVCMSEDHFRYKVTNQPAFLLNYFVLTEPHESSGI